MHKNRFSKQLDIEVQIDDGAGPQKRPFETNARRSAKLGMNPGTVSATGDAAAASLDDAAAAREEERVYDTVLLSEMEYVEDDATYYYQCPCGDMFEITVEDLKNGITIARCPSCSLKVRVDTPLPSEGKRVGGAEGASSTT